MVKMGISKAFQKFVFCCECCDLPGSPYISSDSLFSIPPSHHFPWHKLTLSSSSSSFLLTAPHHVRGSLPGVRQAPIRLRVCSLPPSHSVPLPTLSFFPGLPTAATIARVVMQLPLPSPLQVVPSPLPISVTPMAAMCHPSCLLPSA